MRPKGMSTRIKPIRLQTVDTLRIRRPGKIEPDPCQTALSSVLNCWASSGYGIGGCHALEQQLRHCADTTKYQKPPKSLVNFHISRMFKKMISPRKKK
ncbi:predicted protein [Uncinocarpus reesii 1704]|uniref:37S ribosomal protein mrp10, mitochondrial n=1 Tax=Uncinocarpus reesii (strain UAMH 1704) TaxID=336963 RepID=C4JVI9_UNCRE|nr:uncharacterized protein UREG_06581 [Uncinocarpus reesii 1704]EEP81716.1 predicted protein [Uncinocarpus reesii 1704]